ncbi:MAG: tetratricopeptide repeat protein [Bacteroidales bacterium]
MYFQKSGLIYIIFFVFLLLSSNLQSQFIKDNLIQKAEDEILKSNYTSAILLLNKEIDKNPANHFTYFLRGLSKKELGDNIGAFKDFSTTIQLHPGYSKAYYYRCIQKIDFKDFYSALSDINKAISYNVTNSDFYVARGYVYNVLKDTTNAMHDFKTAIFLNGENGNAYLNKSLLEADMKNFEKALISINKSISISPFNLNAFIIRGFIEQNNKDTLAAKDDYEFVITKDSTHILAYYNLALYYHKLKNYEKAMNNYNKVIYLNPYYSECYYNRAALFADKEKYVEALNDYNHVVKINPFNIYAYYNRAIVKQFLSDFRGALDDFSKVIELYPKYQKAYVLRSNIFMQLKKYKEADNDRKVASYLYKINSDTLISYSADSLYLLPLIDFRSESQAMDSNDGHVQFKSFKIMQKSIYTIIPDNEIPSLVKYNEQIEELNQNKNINLKLRIDNTANRLSYENIAEMKTLLDSLTPQNKINSASNCMWNTVLSGLLKNYSEALQTASKIADTSEYFYLSLFLKGNLYVKMGEQEENIEYNNPFVENKPQIGLSKNFQLAIDEYSSSIEKNKKFTFAYFNRAYTKTLLNDINGAITDYSSCIYFDKTNGEAYYNRGLLYIFLGDKENACPDFSKAGELGITEAYSLLYKYCK